MFTQQPGEDFCSDLSIAPHCPWGRHGESLSPPHNKYAASPSHSLFRFHPAGWSSDHSEQLRAHLQVPALLSFPPFPYGDPPCAFSCSFLCQGPKNILSGATVFLSNSLPSGLSGLWETRVMVVRHQAQRVVSWEGGVGDQLSLLHNMQSIVSERGSKSQLQLPIGISRFL